MSLDPARTERELALMVSAVREYAIFLLDPTGRVASWNPGAERIEGYTAEEVLGRHFSVFYTPEDNARDICAEELEIARRTGQFSEEGWRVRKDGSRFWASVLITALRDETGELVGFGKVTRDMTDRRRAQEELELFASAAAHDLQEPLRTVAGFAELLERRAGDQLPADGREFLAHIRASTERMQGLVVDLLAYARSGGALLEREPAPLRPAALAALAQLEARVRERGAEVRVEVPEGAVVDVSRASLEQLLQNLLSNALKFSDPQDPQVALRARSAPGGWRVEVADNGEGVAAAERERIFRPFSHAAGERGGTGLGLSIAQRLAERHGGHIGVDEAPGGGALFWCELPVPPSPGS